jgi:hypothetical protein
MADLGDIIARAATNAALAQSEQLTGIPFFQQAQARQERESVRQDQLSANQSRLRAALNTGLVTAEDVDAAGGREALVKDKAFDNIFDGLLESNRRRISQEESDEAQMLQARIGAAQAGVILTGGESREEILLRTANARQKEDERERQETLLTQRHTAVSALLEDLRQNPNPSDQEIAATLEAVRVFESQAAEHGKLGGSLTTALRAGVQAAVRGVEQNRAVDQAVQGMRTGSVAALANTSPEHRAAARSNEEVAEAMNTRQRTLTEIGKLRGLDSAVIDELRKVEGMPELIGLLDSIDGASKGGAVTVDTLLNTDGGVELLDRLATADTSSLARNIEQATVRGIQIPQQQAALKGQIEATLTTVPEDGPLAKLVKEWAGQQEIKMLYKEDGTPYAGADPAAPTFSTVVDGFLNDESNSVQDRYLVANRLGAGGAGTLATVEDKAKYANTANELFNQMSRPEQISIEVETTGENIGQVKNRLVESLKKREGEFEYGAQRQDAVEAVTGLPPASELAKKREALKEEAQDELTDSVRQSLLQRNIKALDEEIVRTRRLESFVDDLTDAVVSVYTEDDGQKVLNGILDKFGASTGLDGKTLSGQQAFLDAWDRADGFEQKRNAAIAFLVTAYDDDDIDVKGAAGNFRQLLETAEDGVEQNFPTTTEFVRVSGADPVRGRSMGPSISERVVWDTKGVRRQLSDSLMRAGVPVDVPSKLDREALSALIALNSFSR